MFRWITPRSIPMIRFRAYGVSTNQFVKQNCRPAPINIFSTSYYAPFKLYQIKRILAETSLYAIKELEALWTTYPIPNVFRIDNGLQFRGTARAKKAIGVFLKFLLNMGVTPLFGSPSKPWTNPHVEGHNRVFNEKVWGRNFFTGLEQIDHECEQFNRESLDLFRFRYSELVFNGSTNGAFRYLGQSQSVNCANLETVRGKKIYFIRFVESFERTKKAHVTILNETVRIPEKFAHQFVFVEWNLEEEWLSIYSEYQGVSTLIEKIDSHS